MKLEIDDGKQRIRLEMEVNEVKFTHLDETGKPLRSALNLTLNTENCIQLELFFKEARNQVIWSKFLNPTSAV